MRRPTIADVARTAGVSKATVSRVLNGTSRYVRDETRERILQTIKDLGYRPSTVARSLVSRRTQTIGLLISDVGNPFYAEVFHGVEDVALAHGYDIFLYNTGYDMERARMFARSLADRRMDGALLWTSVPHDVLLEIARHVPVVLAVDRQALITERLEVEGIVGVFSTDFTPGIRMAVEHLVGLGHRRLAHVSGPMEQATARLRRDLFLEAVAACGIDPASVPVVEGNFGIDGGRRALDRILECGPATAILAANDLTAIGVTWAARRHGLRVPEDLSVVGFDNIDLAAEMDPPLTTIDIPRYEGGKAGMQMLLELMQTPHEPQPAPLRSEKREAILIVRQSTAPPGS